MSEVRQRPIAPKTAVMDARTEKAYMRTFKDEPECWGCGKPNDGTVVGAHLNSVGMGHGVGIKTRGAVAPLCSLCHDIIDYRGRLEHYARWVAGGPNERDRIIQRVAQRALQEIAMEWLRKKEMAGG